MKTNINSVLPVLVTPMDKNEEIDWEGLSSNIEFYIDKNIPGLIPLGSTGEYVSLTKQERFEVAERVIEQVNGRIPVIVGATGESTRETIEYVEHAKSIGAEGVMLANPYYSNPLDDEIFEHFKKINNAVDIPIMIYNIEMYTGIDMSAELLIKIGKELSNVTHIKESSGSLQKARDVKESLKGKTEVFCGWDDLAIESFFVGTTGWVSVVANVFPEKALELFNLSKEQKYEEAWKIYKELLPYIQLSYYEGKLVQVTKHAMNYVGLSGGLARTPRLPITPELESRLNSVMKTITGK